MVNPVIMRITADPSLYRDRVKGDKHGDNSNRSARPTS